MSDLRDVIDADVLMAAYANAVRKRDDWLQAVVEYHDDENEAKAIADSAQNELIDVTIASVIAALGDSGRVVVDRARFERMFNVVTAAYEELSESADYGGGGTSHTCAAVEWLQPGDLEPLP